MVIELRDETGVAVIEPAGRLDMRTAAAFKQHLKSLIENGRPWVVLNLGRVDFIDSAGLAALVSGLRLARTHGGDVRLAALQDPVRMIFEITRLHRTFDVYDETDDALAACHLAADPAPHPPNEDQTVRV